MQTKNADLKPFLFLFLVSIGSFFIITTDQLLKYKIRHSGGFYICNTGISFGVPINTVVFWLILVLFILLTFFYLNYSIKNKLLSKSLLLAFSLLLGGVLSNSIDRFLFGCVIDFLSFNATFFPFFNLADVTIFTGVSLVLILFFLKRDLPVHN